MFQVQQSWSAQMVGNHLFQCRKVSLGSHREWRQHFPLNTLVPENYVFHDQRQFSKDQPKGAEDLIKSAKNQRQYSLILCTLMLVLNTQLRINAVLLMSCFLLSPTFLLIRSVLPTFLGWRFFFFFGGVWGFCWLVFS